MALRDKVEMPANNLTLHFVKHVDDDGGFVRELTASLVQRATADQL